MLRGCTYVVKFVHMKQIATIVCGGKFARLHHTLDVEKFVLVCDRMHGDWMTGWMHSGNQGKYFWV